MRGGRNQSKWQARLFCGEFHSSEGCVVEFGHEQGYRAAGEENGGEDSAAVLR